MHDDLPSDDLLIEDRPRGELFRDPAAKVVWAGICALDEASQHDVLDQLRLRLVVFDTRKGDINTKRARAVAALRNAAKRLGGRSPSVADYRRLLNENPALDWPSDGVVRRWLGGSWNTALEQAHLEAVAEPLAAAPALGPRFSDLELTTALRECAEDIGRTPTSDQYMLWIRRPDVTRRPGRRPRSIASFQRAFGGWVAALEAAGLARDTIDGRPFMNGHKSTYSNEDLFRAALQISERIDGRIPTVTEFSAERQKILKEDASKKKMKMSRKPATTRLLPSYNTCSMRFGSWNKFRAAFKEWLAQQPDPTQSGGQS
jgi:hypothetical protein